MQTIKNLDQAFDVFCEIKFGELIKRAMAHPKTGIVSAKLKEQEASGNIKCHILVMAVTDPETIAWFEKNILDSSHKN